MTNTAKLSTAPGCIGSPTMRAMEHPMCTTCVFRTACAKLTGYYQKQLVEVVGESGIHKPARKRDISPTDQIAPRISGEELSEKTTLFLKDLQSLGYNKKELNDLLKTKGRGGTGSRKFPWLLPAIKEISSGCTTADIRKVINDHGIKGTMAASRASQFIKVLCHYGLVRDDEATSKYVPTTGEIT